MRKRKRERNVRKLRVQRAQVLLQQVANRFGVTLEALRSDDRDERLVRARVEYCERANAEKIGSTTIGKVLHRNQATIRYHLRPQMQAVRRNRYLAKRGRLHESGALRYDNVEPFYVSPTDLLVLQSQPLTVTEFNQAKEKANGIDPDSHDGAQPAAESA